MSEAEKYKQMLIEVGGWDNSMVSVNAGAVKEIIGALEKSEKRCAELEKVLEQIITEADFLNDESASKYLGDIARTELARIKGNE